MEGNNAQPQMVTPGSYLNPNAKDFQRVTERQRQKWGDVEVSPVKVKQQVGIRECSGQEQSWWIGRFSFSIPMAQVTKQILVGYGDSKKKITLLAR
jgi:hypothetical protein